MGDAQADLLAYLQRPGLARPLAAVRERWERLGRVGGRASLPDATPEERQAVADLCGLPTLPANPLRLDLPRLDRAFRESRFGVGLEEALTALGGPLLDRAALRAEARRSWEALWAEAAEHPLVRQHPQLERWLAELKGSGLLRRLSGAHAAHPAADLLASSLAVLGELDLPPILGSPGRFSARLPVLASRALGSSHALDAGQPAASLVLRALAALAGRPAPASAGERRELWDWAGVVSDELSCDVLILGLAPEGGGNVGEALRALAAAGEPARLTLRQLASLGPSSFPAGLVVHVCENPVVVAAAADRWGPAVRPLVSIGGQPSQAARRLLADLAARSARLSYHGDFDWAGLRIAGGLLASLPLAPWRFGAADYRRALAAGAEGPPLAGEPVPIAWDPDLPAAMAAAGMAVEEEAVLDELVGDLGPASER